MVTVSITGLTQINKTMEKRQIDYSEIKKLNFKEIDGNCRTHYKKYGYPYKIFVLDITDTLSIDWDQVTRVCTLIRCTDKSGSRIEAKRCIGSLEGLKKLVQFFKESDKKEDYEKNSSNNCIAC